MKFILSLLVCLSLISIEAKAFDLYECVISINLKGMVIHKYENNMYVIYTKDDIISIEEQNLKSINCKDVINNFSIERITELKEILETDIYMLDLIIKNNKV